MLTIIMPIILLDSQHLRLTETAIANIHAFTKDYELIVIHSYSEKYGQEVKKLLRRKDRYIPFKKNISQPRAINIGIKKAKGDYICLIGNDNFVHQNWWDEIKKRLGNKDRQILACSVDRVRSDVWEKEREEYSHTGYIKPANFSYVNFQGVTFPKKVLQQIGRLDENLTFYYWERDLNKRIEQKGYAVGAVMDSYMTTPQSMTRLGEMPKGITNYWSDEAHEKEIAYFYQKWGERA